jgi:hypothetical protein
MDPRMEQTKPVEKKTSKNLKGKKPVQFKLKINLWTIVLAVVAVFFIVPMIIVGIQSVGSSSNVDISQLMVDIKSDKVNPDRER